MKERKFINGESVCTPTELCKMFPVFTGQKLFLMRKRKEGPAFYKIGKRYFYSISSAKAYIESCYMNNGDACYARTNV